MSRPRALSSLAAALGFSVLAAASAAAQPTALIIGNSNYSNFVNLPDAAADATMLAETLGGNGYDVALLTNASAQETRAALSAFFASEAASEHRLFIYSGHVVSVDGVTHLVPADAAVTTGLDLAFNFIAMDDVRAQMERDEIPDVVIMDTNYRHLADNQLKPLLPGAQISDRAAPPADSESTLTLMAVQPGARNLGQKNDANVFATILNNRLSRMDREAVTFLTNVGARVENQSNGRQTPYLSGGFTADVRLNPEVEEPVAEGPTAREQRQQLGEHCVPHAVPRPLRHRGRPIRWRAESPS
ncbi:MAG: caspase family protein [Alphaproteobacteria bacterium]